MVSKIICKKTNEKKPKNTVLVSKKPIHLLISVSLIPQSLNTVLEYRMTSLLVEQAGNLRLHLVGKVLESVKPHPYLNLPSQNKSKVEGSKEAIRNLVELQNYQFRKKVPAFSTVAKVLINYNNRQKEVKVGILQMTRYLVQRRQFLRKKVSR